MLIYQGRNFEGIRLYDKDMEYILHHTWDETSTGIWTEPQIIPEGYTIIGVKANTRYENFLSDVVFILGPEALTNSNIEAKHITELNKPEEDNLTVSKPEEMEIPGPPDAAYVNSKQDDASHGNS